MSPTFTMSITPPSSKTPPSTGSAMTVARVALQPAPHLRMKLPRATGIFQLLPLRPSTCRPLAATPRPASFSEHGVVAARQAGGPYHPAPCRPNNEPRGGSASRPDVPRPPVHATDVQPHQRPAPPNTGNAQLDQRYQQQQEKLYGKQQQEHQKLAQQQERDHQHMQQEQARQANQARQQEMEQRHQQQTQHMEQRHTAQQQHMQQRQQPPRHGQPPPNHEEPRPH